MPDNDELEKLRKDKEELEARLGAAEKEFEQRSRLMERELKKAQGKASQYLDQKTELDQLREEKTRTDEEYKQLKEEYISLGETCSFLRHKLERTEHQHKQEIIRNRTRYNDNLTQVREKHEAQIAELRQELE